MNRAFKTIFSLMLVLIFVIGVMLPIIPNASAAEFKSHKGDSDVWLVDANTKKAASTIKLYGRADYICLKLKKDSEYYASFCFKMYSDSKYKKEVLSYSTAGEDENQYVTLAISFDNIKSGTYYVKTYVIKEEMFSHYYNMETSKDPTTERTYKIKITKSGTDIDEMNTVMYGFENTEKGPKIYWYSVSGATGYYLYRKNPKTGKYSKIKTVKDSGEKFTTYTDKTYKGENATRYYRVVAYKGSSKTPASLKAMKVKILKTPVITIEPKADNKIKVSWSKVASGAEYTLLMRSGDSDWSEVKTTESRSATVNMKKRKNNKPYYFTVIANVDGVLSGYNVKGKVYKNIKAPELLDCIYSDDGVTINWKKVKGSDQYTIYKKVKKKWKEIAVVDGKETSYTDTQSDCYAYNTYTVRSMSNGSLKTYLDKGISGIKFEEIVLNEIIEDNGKLKISWVNPIEKQKCDYKLYIKKGDKWEYYDTVSDNEFYYYIDKNVLKYEFNVCATYKGFTGPLNQTGISYIYYPTIDKPTVVADPKGALVSWDELDGVDGYVLYKENTNGEFDIIAQTTDTSFLDTEIANDTAYSYKIAYVSKGEIITQKESEKTTVTFVDEIVNINPGNYKPNYGSYTVEISDFASDGSKYLLYKKVDYKWVRVNNSYYYPSSGEIKIPCGTGVTEFALLKIYADGRMTRLPKNGFIVDFDGCANDVKFSNDNDKVIFSWDPEMFDADKVLIYKNEEFLGEAERKDGKFIEENVQPNKEYFYTIYTQTDNFISEKNVFKKFTYLKEPEFTVKPVKTGVYISWEKIEADCYVDVYRAKGSSNKFKKIGYGYHNWEGICDESVTSGTTYRYAIVLRNDEGYEAPYNPEGKTITYFKGPDITSADCSKNGVKVVWSEVAEADNYVLSYKQKGRWHVLADLPAGTTSFVDKTIQSGTKRVYMVYACIGEHKSAQSQKTACFLDRPSITEISSTTKKIKISYGEVEGATDYKIFYKKGNSDKWKTLGTTSKTSYTHKIKDPNVKYTYAVSAVWVKSGKDCISYKSPSKKAKNLATPELDTIKSTKSGIKITWNKTSYATGYNVYRKISDGEFEKLAYVKGNETVKYTDKTAKKGKTYTYTVRATYGDCVSGCNKTGLKCKDKY